MARGRGPDGDRSTAERILAVAAELFARKGFHATTTREIAAAVGVRGASVYHHFPSKSEILYEIARRTMEDLLAVGRQAVASSAEPERQLRRLVEWHVHYHADRRVQARVADEQLDALSPARRAEVVALRDEYEGLFRSVLAAGRDRRDWPVDDVAVTTFAIATMASGVGAWFREGGRLSPAAVASIYGDLAVRAVGCERAGVSLPAAGAPPR